jgi:hypothetical protein
VSHLTRDELTAYSRRTERDLEIVYIKLCATAGVTVRILKGLIQGVMDVAATLAAIEAPWAQIHGKELVKAVDRAKINPRDREGEVLLGLPGDGDEAALETWLRAVKALDENSGWVVAACRYALARDQTLRTVATEVAAALSATNEPEAKACAARLREAVAKVVVEIR